MRRSTVWRCAPVALAVCFFDVSLMPRPVVAWTVWNYDFGPASGPFTSGESTSFLPTPPADGGTSRVRIGSGGGQFEVLSLGGGGTQLVGAASATTSVNKFSIYDFSGTDLFTLQTTLTFSGGDSGSWQLFVGNGATYSNNNTFAMSETFTGLRWDYEPSAGLTMSRRADGSESWLVSSLPVVAQNTSTTFTIYGNNSSSAVSYAGTTIAPGTWDLWVDGTPVSSGLPKASLADGVAVDSLMVFGASSTGNAATLAIEELSYANAVPEPGGWPLVVAGVASLLVIAGRGNWAKRCRRRRPTGLRLPAEVCYKPKRGAAGFVPFSGVEGPCRGVGFHVAKERANTDSGCGRCCRSADTGHHRCGGRRQRMGDAGREQRLSRRRSAATQSQPGAVYQ